MIQWTERYGSFTATVGRGTFAMTVSWNASAPKGSPSGYTVVVAGRKLKNLYPDAEKGKVAAIVFAKMLAQEILKDLA